ncbi:MAG: OmpA family protein [Cyclobacteriaceae bacterium]|nr:OmpA family protein [Cyclobacteriaceae bacterium]
MRIFILILLAIASASAQNLVPNGSFEEFYKCPGSYNYEINEKFAPGWFSANRGTPDLFNACSKGDAGVPTSWAGFSKAYSGVGYAGIYCYTKNGYREYLQTELTELMQTGGKYYIEFYYKLSSNSKYSIDRIGLAIADSAKRRKDDFVVYGIPTYELILPAAYTRSTGVWAKCSYTYLAKGGEKFITIGNFSNNANTRTFHIQFSKAKEAMLNTAAYYFIDDVSVRRLDFPKVEKPLIITGYPEIKVNKVYVLKNIFFDFDSYRLIGDSFQELDKWIKGIQARPNWNIILTGHTDERGTDDYNLKLSEQRVKAVANYLIEKGVDSARITVKGEGKRKPLSNAKDEAAHALNRRVEIEFVNKE